uniref:Secreted protein n=1 Tax=Arundo donax TaxID=35708 RepID=A0A0A9A8S1_ARUDO
MFHQSWSPNLIASLLPISFLLRVHMWNKLYCPMVPDHSLLLAGCTRRLREVIKWRGHSHPLPLRCSKEHVQVDSRALHTDMTSRTKAPTSKT